MYLFFCKKKDIWGSIEAIERRVRTLHSTAVHKDASIWGDSFLHGTSANYIDAMYNAWKKKSK
ncbi:unnamed protein product [Pneumocystis jirovecii]|uniref:2-oxoglutarate dehydrogenase E1 component N-terminal domain-containing protein n=1 Tax=Pneumocystis jirovecii TaxID=42068 RepID=L0PGB1_PNEJI|nr:unnamed protein product [Pneumocystis jirovecii]